MSNTTIITAKPKVASTTEKLHRLMARFPDEGITLGNLVDDLGAAATGLGLLLFSLMALIPGIAPVFGLALCAGAFGMVPGQAEPLMPDRLLRRRMDRGLVENGLQRLTPVTACRSAWRSVTASRWPLVCWPSSSLWPWTSA